MTIDFDRHRWDNVIENADRWWAGRLNRPLIQIRLRGHDAWDHTVFNAIMRMTAFDPSVSAREIVEKWHEDLSNTQYLGDAFPAFWPDFGPGIIAGFLGAKLDVRPDTVWFLPPADRAIRDVRLEFDPENEWLRRITDIYRAALDRWQGLVQIGMTDIGGNLDVLATFRPGEKLLLDLYDDPDHVKRLTADAHNLWWQYFDLFNDLLQPTNPGYCTWASIFSPKPHYMLQCDFCHMISPDMFDEFVKPELAKTCRRLENPFYHLDGPGQLRHLDSLLTIENLKGIQWVPGAGQPDHTHWPEVYRKIRDAGKLIQLFGTMETLDAVAEQIGTANGIVLAIDAEFDQHHKAQAFLEKYRIA